MVQNLKLYNANKLNYYYYHNEK
jgi:hypothetical protein